MITSTAKILVIPLVLTLTACGSGSTSSSSTPVTIDGTHYAVVTRNAHSMAFRLGGDEPDDLRITVPRAIKAIETVSSCSVSREGLVGDPGLLMADLHC